MSDAVTEPGWVEELVALIHREMEEKAVPAVAVGLYDTNGILWEAGFGSGLEATATATRTDTVFRVGSISKLFTAVALMQLHERGILDAGVPIGELCPELVFLDGERKPAPITLRHLLSHRSGIVRESPVGGYFDDSEPSIRETVAGIIGTNLVYPPGTRTKYSNLGPTVAGYILERVTGRSFPEYLREEVLDPLGMASSSFLRDIPATVERLAPAFLVDFDGNRIPAPVFQLGTIPAGNLYSTVSDLGRFMTCLLNDGRYAGGRLLDSATLAEMMIPPFGTNDVGLHF